MHFLHSSAEIIRYNAPRKDLIFYSFYIKQDIYTYGRTRRRWPIASLDLSLLRLRVINHLLRLGFRVFYFIQYLRFHMIKPTKQSYGVLVVCPIQPHNRDL